VRNNIPFSLSGPSATDIVTLVNVPAGRWWVLGSGSVVYQDSAGGSDYFRCGLTVEGTPGNANAVARVGLDAFAAAASQLVVHQGVTLTAPSTIRLRCGHDVNLAAGNPRMDHAQLTAIRTDDLQIQPG
jgi:hypothetical protein